MNDSSGCQDCCQCTPSQHTDISPPFPQPAASTAMALSKTSAGVHDVEQHDTMALHSGSRWVMAVHCSSWWFTMDHCDQAMYPDFVRYGPS